VQFFSGSKMPDFHASEGRQRRALGLRTQPSTVVDSALDQQAACPLDLISLYGMGIAGGTDLNHFSMRRSPSSLLYSARRLLRHTRDLLQHGRGMHLVNGNALVAACSKAQWTAGAPVH
jgi:hypothetical protein